MNKPFEELDVIDDFLINAIASDPNVGEPFCRTVLSVLLQRKIDKLRIVAQKAIPAFFPEFRGIRMDVEIQEDITYDDCSTGPAMNIYDLEPHLQKDVNFPRHNRFYQAKIDSNLMKSGDNDFSRMPNLYVLTITNFDIFGEDYMMYSFQNRCDEVPELEYNDGLKFIYFYTGGTKGGSHEIKSMLRYLQNSNSENISNEATKEIHNYVKQIKVLPEVKREYMRFEELMLYAQQKGEAEGRAKGEAEGRAKGEAEGRAKGAAEGRLEGRTEGRTEGTRTSLIILLNEIGTVPDSLKDRINQETDLDTLKNWLRLAIKSDSISNFLEKIQ